MVYNYGAVYTDGGLAGQEVVYRELECGEEGKWKGVEEVWLCPVKSVG